MKKKHVHLAIGIGAFLFGIAVSVEQYLLPLDQPTEEVMISPEIQTLIENGIPASLIIDYPKYNKKQSIPNDMDTVLHHGKDYWRIYFMELESLQGKWYGKEPTFQKQVHNSEDSTSCIITRYFRSSTSTMGWVSISQQAKNKPFRPYLKINLETDTCNSCLHTTVDGTAKLTATFPKYDPNNSTRYYEKDQKLERDIHFFLISAAELQILEQLFPPKRLDPKERVYSIILPPILGLFVGWLIIQILRGIDEERKKKRWT